MLQDKVALKVSSALRERTRSTNINTKHYLSVIYPCSSFGLANYLHGFPDSFSIKVKIPASAARAEVGECSHGYRHIVACCFIIRVCFLHSGLLATTNSWNLDAAAANLTSCFCVGPWLSKAQTLKHRKIALGSHAMLLVCCESVVATLKKNWEYSSGSSWLGADRSPHLTVDIHQSII